MYVHTHILTTEKQNQPSAKLEIINFLDVFLHKTGTKIVRDSHNGILNLSENAMGLVKHGLISQTKQWLKEARHVYHHSYDTVPFK